MDLKFNSRRLTFYTHFIGLSMIFVHSEPNLAKHMKRTSFLKGIALGTVSLPIAIRALAGKKLTKTSSAKALDAQQYEWKLVTTWPPNFPIMGDTCTYFAKLVDEMSGGRMKIRVFGGGELMPALEIFDGVRSGAAEIGHGAAYYWAGKSPAAQFFSTVPFGMNAQQAVAWITSGGGLQLWEELYANYNLIPMIGGNTGVQMGGWFNREINTIQDLQGLKMRIPGLGGQVLAKAGGSPVLLAGGELYTSLERGVIDAAEWVGPYHDNLMGFNEIARYYYTPGWHEPGTVFEFIFNKEKFEALPSDLQAILRTASYAAHLWCFCEMENRNKEAMVELKAKKTEIREFPQEVLDTLRQLTEEVIEEMVSGDSFAKRVYESYSTYQRQANAYAEISEKVFYAALSKSVG